MYRAYCIQFFYVCTVHIVYSFLCVYRAYCVQFFMCVPCILHTFFMYVLCILCTVFLCMYRAYCIQFLFQPTMHNIFFYFNNIYVIITPTCFDTFVSSSESSKGGDYWAVVGIGYPISATVQCSPLQHKGKINTGICRFYIWPRKHNNDTNYAVKIIQTTFF